MTDTAQKNPEAATTLAGSAGPLTLFNGVFLLASNAAAVFAGLYADLFPNSGVGQFRVVLGVVWVAAALLVVPWVLGFNSKEARGQIERVAFGYKVIWQDKFFGCVVLGMMAVAALFIGSRFAPSPKQEGGLLRSLVAYADRTEAAALAAEGAAKAAEGAAKRTEVAVQQVDRKADEVLTKTKQIQEAVRGANMTSDRYHQALVNGDIEVLKEMLEGGWKPLSYEPRGDGNSLGHYFGRTAAGDNAVEVIKVLKQHTDLTASTIKVGASPLKNAASVAASTCNRTMVEALAKAGVDVRLQNKPAVYPGGYKEQDIETTLMTWKMRDFDMHRCEPSDREAILKLIRPVSYR